MRGFGLLTRKPMLVILNASEDEALGPRRGARASRQVEGEPKVAFSEVSAPIQQEIAAMSSEDEAEF